MRSKVAIIFTACCLSLTSCATSGDGESNTDGLGLENESATAEPYSDVDSILDGLESTAAQVEDTSVPVSEEPLVQDEPALPHEQLVEEVMKDDVESYKLNDGNDLADTTPKQPSSDYGHLEDSSSALPVAEPQLELGTNVEPYAATPEPISDYAIDSVDSSNAQSVNDVILYPVVRGDSLSLIARKLMGGIRHWKRLADYNEIQNPNTLRVGRVLKIPVDESNQSLVDSFTRKHTKSVKVKRGDTLGKIAARVLGSPAAWRYLWKNNESVISNPDRIRVGTTLNYLDVKNANGVAAKKAASANQDSH